VSAAGAVAVPQGAFYLAGVRPDGYREYGYAAAPLTTAPLAARAVRRE
jgi:hypothetical protein